MCVSQDSSEKMTAGGTDYVSLSQGSLRYLARRLTKNNVLGRERSSNVQPKRQVQKRKCKAWQLERALGKDSKSHFVTPSDTHNFRCIEKKYICIKYINTKNKQGQRPGSYMKLSVDVVFV